MVRWSRSDQSVKAGVGQQYLLTRFPALCVERDIGRSSPTQEVRRSGEQLVVELSICCRVGEDGERPTAPNEYRSYG